MLLVRSPHFAIDTRWRRTSSTEVVAMLSFKTVVCIAGVTILLLATCLAEHHLTNTQLEKLSGKNSFRSTKYKCQPRKRAILISSLTDVDSELIYLPRMTVLARCDNFAGCCQNLGEKCVMKVSKHVTLVFRTQNGVWKDKPSGFKVVNAENHTECECMRDGNEIIKK